MREHKMTLWEAGNDLCACADYLGEKEEDLYRAGHVDHAKVIREARILIAKHFNINHSRSHEFALGPTQKRGP